MRLIRGSKSSLFVLLCLLVLAAATIVLDFHWPYVVGRWNWKTVVNAVYWPVVAVAFRLLTKQVLKLGLDRRVQAEETTLAQARRLRTLAVLCISPVGNLKGLSSARDLVNLTMVAVVFVPIVLTFVQNLVLQNYLSAEPVYRLNFGEKVQVALAPAGGGEAMNREMTGHELMFNTSNGCLTSIENRFVYVLNNSVTGDANRVLVPMLPDIGTYARKPSKYRAGDVFNVPAVLCTTSFTFSNVVGIEPSSNYSETTLPGKFSHKIGSNPASNGSIGILVAEMLFKVNTRYRQIAYTFVFQTVTADFRVATFNNGTSILDVLDYRTVDADIPKRLNGSLPMSLDAVLDNLMGSQNGVPLTNDDTGLRMRISNSANLLAGAFAIRSAQDQNYIDQSSKAVDFIVAQERIGFRIGIWYWVVFGLSLAVTVVSLFTQVLTPQLDGSVNGISAALDHALGPVVNEDSTDKTNNPENVSEKGDTEDQL